MTMTQFPADTAIDPRTGEALGDHPWSTDSDVDAAVAAASAAAPLIAQASGATRESWLDAIAARLLLRSETLVEVAAAETGIAADDLRGEVAYAAANLRYYGAAGREADARASAIDETPVGPRIRSKVPVGVVAVFGASNFPFGFGMLGHDTASAIAAGCPVIAKAHPAHPALSSLLTEIATDGLADMGAPAGVFQSVRGFQPGIALVDHHDVRAIAFTGSTRGGIAITARGNSRGVPVYAEMGTVNPVVMTSSAAPVRSDTVVEEYLEKLLDRAGQFCTKPGIVFVPEGAVDRGRVEALLAATPPQTLLTPDIAARYRASTARLAEDGQSVVRGQEPGADFAATAQVSAALLLTDTVSLPAWPEFTEECFGPFGIICTFRDLDEIRPVLARMQPSLAFSVFGDPAAQPAELRSVLSIAAAMAGRIPLNEWPTGVPTSPAQHHGGPWPATSRPDATSVGTAALERFSRPVTLQAWPTALDPVGAALGRTA
jgi:NADP-dependent aldehyde dehydrogenase